MSFNMDQIKLKATLKRRQFQQQQQQAPLYQYIIRAYQPCCVVSVNSLSTSSQCIKKNCINIKLSKHGEQFGALSKHNNEHKRVN